MASIIRNEFATTMSSAFLDKFGQGATGTDNLFMVIGQPLPWTSAPWSAADDITAPVPNGSITQKTQAENYAIAAKRIPQANVQMVIPKVKWTSGVSYTTFDGSLADPYAPTNWYVVNSLNEVFICTVDPGVATSTVEPTKAIADANDGKFTGVQADGYNWEFMYTVAGAAAKANTQAWVPVNYGPTINIAGGENPQAYRRLGVDNVMIIGEIDATLTYIGDDYRQIMVYKNLTETDGTTPAAADLYQIPDATWQAPGSEGDLAGLVGLAASDLIYHENRSPILRSDTQIEELKIVLSFG